MYSRVGEQAPEPAFGFSDMQDWPRVKVGEAYSSEYGKAL